MVARFGEDRELVALVDEIVEIDELGDIDFCASAALLLLKLRCRCTSVEIFSRFLSDCW